MGMTMPEITSLFTDVKTLWPDSTIDSITIEQEDGKMALIKFAKEEVGESNGSFELLPAGKYTGQICNHGWKHTKSGGHMLALTLEITDGATGIGRKLFDNLNIDCDNEEAQKISLRAYKAICMACNEETFYDAIFDVDDSSIEDYLGMLPERLYGCDISLNVGVEKSKDPQYPDKNKVKAYGPASAPVPKTVSVKPAAKGKPSWAK